MKLIIQKRKLKINKIDSFWNRFKCMKFKLETLKEAYLFENKKYISTYFFCQKVDIIMTDENNNITYLSEKVKSEKIILRKGKTKNIYIVPLETVKYLTIEKKLSIQKESD